MTIQKSQEANTYTIHQTRANSKHFGTVFVAIKKEISFWEYNGSNAISGSVFCPALFLYCFCFFTLLKATIKNIQYWKRQLCFPPLHLANVLTVTTSCVCILGTWFMCSAHRMPVLSLCLWFKYIMDIDTESLRECFGIVGITELRCLREAGHCLIAYSSLSLKP